MRRAKNWKGGTRKAARVARRGSGWHCIFPPSAPVTCRQKSEGNECYLPQSVPLEYGSQETTNLGTRPVLANVTFSSSCVIAFCTGSMFGYPRDPAIPTTLIWKWYNGWGYVDTAFAGLPAVR